MGKVRTRILGLEDLEQQQKEEQKKRSAEKKAEKGQDADVSEVEAKEEKPSKKKAKKVEDTKRAKKGKSHARGAKYVKSAKQIDKEVASYKVADAIPLLKKLAYAKFPEAVELHLNVDKTGLKGEVDLPHSTGKTVRVAVVDDKLLEKIEEGKIEFDILVSHPSFMPKLAKYAKILGPRGLMPNPKAGTVSPKPEEVVKKFEKGVLQWKSEPKAPIVHQMVAKLASSDKEIEENVMVFLNSVGKAHISTAFIKTTMSPALQLSLQEIS
jgi:large subunit ribosomal protein L1